MDERKVCFILYHAPGGSPGECLESIRGVRLPEGFEAELLEIREGISVSGGFDEAMTASDAPYKVYLTTAVRLLEPELLIRSMELFRDRSIGMIGVVGAPVLSRDGVIRHTGCVGALGGEQSYGEADSICCLRPVSGAWEEVEAAEGFLLVTRVDLPWMPGMDSFLGAAHSLAVRRAGLRVAVPAQDGPWCCCSCLDFFRREKEEERQRLLAAYPEVFAGKTWARAVLFYSDRIGIMDLAFALQRRGHEVDVPDFPVSLSGRSGEETERIGRYLRDKHMELALTYDFSPNVAEACHREGIPYGAWIYDAPLPELYTPQAGYGTSCLFLFDRAELARLREHGGRQLFHLPLAASGEPAETEIPDGELPFYTADVSFVGKLYEDRTWDDIFGQAGPALAEQWRRASAPECIWGKDRGVFGSAPEELVRYAARRLTPPPSELFSLSDRYYVETMIIARKRNENERRQVLERLGQRFHTVLYTDGSPAGLTGVEVRRSVDYYEELPRVYAHSKINLNITSRSIETGVPQRVFDVLRCGGFLLTNYQEELEELFCAGRDLEVFHDLEELEEKAAYYLTHEEQRRAIAQRGQLVALKRHTCEARLDEILKYTAQYRGQVRGMGV